LSAATVALLCLLAAGCYTYVPISPATVPPQEEVRVRFTDEAAIRLAREFGQITTMVESQLEPLGQDSLALSIWIGRDYRGTQFENVHQKVNVGRHEVVEVRRRQLSKPRTVIAGAGVLALFAVLIDKVVLQEDPNPPGGENPPPPPPQPPMIGIRIPIGWR
jgi:hypothetical protein